MNLTRPTASALSGLLVASMVVTVPARAQEGDDLGGMVSKSLAAMNAEKWEEALAILDAAIKRFGKNPQLFGPQFGVLYYRKGICEMKVKRWGEAMKSIFPDVDKGDRLTGVNLPGRGAKFFRNGQPIGEVPDPDFAAAFFGIWFDPKTSRPDFRKRLLGET